MRRRMRIAEPIADASKRTIAELLERIEKLEGNLAKDRIGGAGGL